MTGVPLVLLHPVGLDRHWYAALEAALAPRFETLPLDLPGHGDAPHVRGASLEQLAQALLAQRLPARFHLAGVSVGGMIAQHMCALAPDRVISATLVATAAAFAEPTREVIRARAETIRATREPDSVPETISRWFTDPFQSAHPRTIAECCARLRANSPDVIADYWAAIADLDTCVLLPGISCPASVVVGDQDTATPILAAREIAARIPNARLYVLKDVSHIVQLEAPLRLAEIIRDTAARGLLKKGA